MIEQTVQASSPLAYVGMRGEEQTDTFIVRQWGERDDVLPIVCYQDDRLCNLQPTWGYGGHGPHDAAYSILCDVFPEHIEHRETVAWAHTSALTGEFLALFDWPPQEAGVVFTLRRDFLLDWLERHIGREAREVTWHLTQGHREASGEQAMERWMYRLVCAHRLYWLWIERDWDRESTTPYAASVKRGDETEVASFTTSTLYQARRRAASAVLDRRG